MAETVIKIENIGKKYKIGEKEKYLTLRDVFTNIVKIPYQFLIRKKLSKKLEFWALKGISIEVKKGEAIGVIGRNGAGKTTLLKILSRITEPTEGKITIKGKVSSLLEVGTGFHAELTGRENIYLNGAILGMSKKEIDRKFADIIEFSGVEKFLDTPVKRYSSGMRVRLAFAVAAHLEPEIMLIDEVLAVGDIEFQKKCLGKMDEVTKKAGRTILFVSHNMEAIQSLCQRCVLLNDGRIEAIGETGEIVKKYLELAQNELKKEVGPYQTSIEGFYLKTIKLNSKHKLCYNQSLKFELILSNNEPIKNLQVGLQIINSRLAVIMTAKVDVPKIDVGKHKLCITIENPYLPIGKYNLTLGMGSLGRGIFYEVQILSFDISPTGIEDGFVMVRKDTLGVYPPVDYILEKAE